MGDALGLATRSSTEAFTSLEDAAAIFAEGPLRAPNTKRNLAPLPH